MLHENSPQVAPTHLPLWRNHDYLLLLVSQCISQLGTQASQLAFPLLVYAFSGSAAWTGAATGLVAWPFVVLCLPAGAFVDRLDRKRLMLMCDVSRGIILASIPLAMWLGHLTLLHLCLAALGEGICYTFFSLAEASCLPQVVAPEQIAQATGQQGVAAQLAYTIGPSLGGGLLALGRALPFLVDAASYAVSVAALLRIRGAFQQERKTEQARGNLRLEIAEGLRWLLGQRTIRFLALLAGVGNAVDNFVFLFFLVMLTRAGISPGIIGLGYALTGLAGILGAGLSDKVQARWGVGRVSVATQVLMCMLLPLFFLAQRVPLLLLVAAPALAFLSILQGYVQYAYRRTLIPDGLQGRVNSLFRLIAYGGPPLAILLTGLLLQISPTLTVGVFTALCAVVTLLTICHRDLRAVGPIATT